MQQIMESSGEENAAKLLRAQTHLYSPILGFINFMSLKCAIDLCIPDVIHKYGQPMPLSKLIASLPIHPSKTTFIYRLMRILTHSGLFSQQNVTENELEVRYELNDASRLLLKDHPFSMTPWLCEVDCAVELALQNPWYQFHSWLKNDVPTMFETEHGMGFWDYVGHEPKLNHWLNNTMASDTVLVSSVVIEKCEGLFKGLESLVDVGGGTGIMAKAIAKAFPQLQCTVFDLPRVVAGLHGSDNLKYVGGNMFEAIPPADAILLKWVLHNWKDEECVKLLKKCKDAIKKPGKEGKVIIIDIVVGNEPEDDESLKTQLLFDMQMMMLFNGKERNEKEWSNLILSAGFSDYKIIPIPGLSSLIEIYP